MTANAMSTTTSTVAFINGNINPVGVSRPAAIMDGMAAADRPKLTVMFAMPMSSPNPPPTIAPLRIVRLDRPYSVATTAHDRVASAVVRRIPTKIMAMVVGNRKEIKYATALMR